MSFTYTLQKGDTLSEIAERFGVPLQALEAANPQIKTPDLILPGQVISIPTPGNHIYVVQPGDTISAIAERFGVSLKALEAANPQIKNPDLIFPGQHIRIGGNVAVLERPLATDTALATEIQMLVSSFSSMSVASSLVQTDVATLDSWLAGDASPSDEQQSAIHDIVSVAESFTEIWVKDLFEGWLNAPNPHLNFSTPWDLIRLGDTEAVVAAINSAAYGVYA